ncbi:MAG: GntR family transcriptional regulator [Bacteroidetes bacterium]|nr:GntR family transcriptional regulator [Bacteroidota bacterium]
MEFNDKQAIYLQIVEYIYDRILTNEWQGDERVPSVRDLAVELQVNPNTVMRAYELLQNNEIIVNKRGVGNFLSGDAKVKIRENRRNNFLRNELPVIFRNMQLLGVSMDDLTRRYSDYNKMNEKPQ